MQLKGATIGATLALIALTAVGVRYKLSVLAKPETAIVLNTLSLALFVMFCEESPEYNGAEATKPNAFVKKLSNRQVGALVLGAMILSYMYAGWSCVREARAAGGGLLHDIAVALPRSTTLP